ncbi:MAG: hypothetical protein M1821_005677 [Bathelium mastoideum]|nr:MAG: hypothetical protein M1821_005677 [Bathelium mastoideum]
MPDPFSLLTGSIGMADVVLRASLELYRFLCDIEDAPSEIQSLQDCVRETRLLVESSKKCLEAVINKDLSTSAPDTDLNKALPLLKSAISAIERAQNSLMIAAKRHKNLGTSWSKIKQYSSFGQTQTENTLRRRLGQVAAEADDHKQALSLTDERQKKISIAQEKLVDIIMGQTRQLSQVENGVHITSQVGQVEHEKTRERVAEVKSKIDHLCSTVSRLPAPAKVSKREIFFVGQSPEIALKPFFLMRDHIHSAVLSMRSHRVNQRSLRCVFWLQSEVEDLQSSLIQEVAALSQGSTASSLDRWHYSQQMNSSFKRHPQRRSAFSDGDLKIIDTTRSQRSRSDVVARPKRLLHYEYFSYESPIGRLSIKIPFRRYLAYDYRLLDKVKVFFRTYHGICSTAIAVTFSRPLKDGTEPNLCIQLQALHIVNHNKLHERLCLRSSLEEIDVAIRKGIVSPFDVDENGWNMFLVTAIASGRVDVFRHFESHGVGLLGKDSEPAALFGFFYILRRILLPTEIPNLFEMIRYFKENISEAALCGYWELFFAIAEYRWDYSGVDEQLWEALRDMYQWNKAGRDPMGCSRDLDTLFYLNGIALGCGLFAEGIVALKLVRTVLKTNTNPCAALEYFTGFCAIQYAMGSGHITGADRDIKKEKLSLLIAEKADIHFYNGSGRTPSYLALYEYDCWDEWCQALSRNGIHIDRVLQQERFWTRLEDRSWIFSKTLLIQGTQDSSSARIDNEEKNHLERTDEG